MTKIGITATIGAPRAAADAISSLQGQGYNVMVDGTADVALSECTASAILGPFDCTIDAQRHRTPGRRTTLDADTSCGSAN
jgi:hypothetical protein